MTIKGQQHVLFGGEPPAVLLQPPDHQNRAAHRLGSLRTAHSHRGRSQRNGGLLCLEEALKKAAAPGIQRNKQIMSSTRATFLSRMAEVGYQ